MKFKERSHPYNTKVKGEAASYLEDLLKIINEGIFTKQQIVLYKWNSFVLENMTFIAKEEKSMSGFKISKDSGLLGANATHVFELKSMLITPKDLGPLRIMLNLYCLYSTNGTIKPGWQHICFQHSLLLRITAEGKKKKKKRFLSWSPRSADGDAQWDKCCWHACEHNIHFLAHGSRGNFDYQFSSVTQSHLILCDPMD